MFFRQHSSGASETQAEAGSPLHSAEPASVTVLA